jgi:hypothetical protein
MEFQWNSFHIGRFGGIDAGWGYSPQETVGQCFERPHTDRTSRPTEEFVRGLD